MYRAIWRTLPGPRWLKAIEAVLLAVAGVAALFTWVFPSIADDIGLFTNTVG